MLKKFAPIAVSLLALALSGCAKDGDIDINSGVGVTATRTGCPIVAVPEGTGDVTLFNPTSSQDASAVDVVATITKLRPSCNSSGERIYSVASFELLVGFNLTEDQLRYNVTR